MPHFVIECSENVLSMKSPAEIMEAVYAEADSIGLFAPNDIKVRISPFAYYKLGNEKSSFLNIFAYIMERRTTEQKANLSKIIIERLNLLLPELSILSMNITDFELATYCNKTIINPANKDRSRHFGL